MKSVGVVILAGGQNRRMGTNKALLTIAGETFLSRLQKQVAGFEEVLLSVDAAQSYQNCGLPLVQDAAPGCGPIGGIYSALSVCRSPFLLALSCDLPFFTADMANFICSYLAEGYDAYAAVTRDGRVHPLCCIYSKSALPALEKRVQTGDLRLTDALVGLKTKYIPFEYSAFPDEALLNVNNHAQYIEACRRVQGPPVVAVSGVKNSGKTTLLSKVIPLLRAGGLRVAAIKHDGHNFEPDRPGTDSHRLREAGADAVAVYSATRSMVTKEEAGPALEGLLALCREADLILLEGGKNSPCPKIEVVRGAVSGRSVCDPATLIALCTDTGLTIPGVPRLHPDQPEAAVALLQNYIRGEYYPDTSAWEQNPVLYGFPIPNRPQPPEDSGGEKRA